MPTEAKPLLHIARVALEYCEQPGAESTLAPVINLAQVHLSTPTCC